MGDDNGSTPRRALVVHNEALLEVIKGGLADCGIESEALSCDASAPPVVSSHKNARHRSGVVSPLIDARNNVRIAMNRIKGQGSAYDFVLCGCDEPSTEKESPCFEELLFLISLCAERRIPCIVLFFCHWFGRFRVFVSTSVVHSFEDLREKSAYIRFIEGDPRERSFWAQMVVRVLSRVSEMELWSTMYARSFRQAYRNEHGQEWEPPAITLSFPSVSGRRTKREALRSSQREHSDESESTEPMSRQCAQVVVLNHSTHNRLKKREVKKLKSEQKKCLGQRTRVAKPKGTRPISHKKTTKKERKEQKQRARDERKRFLKKQRKSNREVKISERCAG